MYLNPGGKLIIMKQYEGIKNELNEQYKYKIELHAHTSPASGCADLAPCDVIDRYADIGFDCIAITNHFYKMTLERLTTGTSKEDEIEAYLKDFHEAKKRGEERGIKVILGAELRFKSQNDNDYLIFGIDEKDLFDIYDYLDGTYEDFYRAYKNDKNFLIQAHPFREGLERADADCVDGVEGFNLHPNHNSGVALSTKFGKDNQKIIVAGTDFHHEGHQGLANIRTVSCPCNSFELAEILKNDDFLLETMGTIILV